jgi:Tfp pilus assembly protein PilE
MGQQQLLLLVLAVIIVGIAIVVGITMFRAQSASSNLDAVTNDLMNLASRAQQYYVRPTSMGGGGNFFTGMTIGHLTPAQTGATTVTNENGTYSVPTVQPQRAVIHGVGTQDGDGDNTPCTADVVVLMPAGTCSLAVSNR